MSGQDFIMRGIKKKSGIERKSSYVYIINLKG